MSYLSGYVCDGSVRTGWLSSWEPVWAPVEPRIHVPAGTTFVIPAGIRFTWRWDSRGKPIVRVKAGRG